MRKSIMPEDIVREYKRVKALGLSFDFDDDDIRATPLSQAVTNKKGSCVLLNKKDRDALSQELDEIFGIYISDERLNEVIFQIMIISLQLEVENNEY